MPPDTKGGRPPPGDRPDDTAAAATSALMSGASLADLPRCRRCHRPLTSPLATASGFGPVCAQHVLGAAPARVRVQLSGQDPLPGMEVTFT